jgi:hypothetical protein
MSSIANLRSAPAALAQVDIHPHGHKKGSHVQSNGGSDTTPPLPVSAAKNLFSHILQSLEQVIGLQLTPATPVAAESPMTASASTAGAASTAAQAASTPLQIYLHNARAAVHTDVSTLSINA